MRNLNFIANEILVMWEKPYFGAVPYIHAMRELNDITDSYGWDDGRSIVTYFLATKDMLK